MLPNSCNSILWPFENLLLTNCTQQAKQQCIFYTTQTQTHARFQCSLQKHTGAGGNKYICIYIQVHTYVRIRHFRVHNLLTTNRAHLLAATMRGRSGNMLKLKTQIKAKSTLRLQSRRDIRFNSWKRLELSA